MLLLTLLGLCFYVSDIVWCCNMETTLTVYTEIYMIDRVASRIFILYEYLHCVFADFKINFQNIFCLLHINICLLFTVYHV